jgi:hypothetical protein
VSGELREAGMFDLRVRVEAHATVLGVLHRDALSITQPIDVKPRSGD